MTQATADRGTDPRSISFKHTVQLWTQWHASVCPGDHEPDITLLFELIAAVCVGHRAGRHEPRAQTTSQILPLADRTSACC